jgi:FkbM family methyltransferase
MRAVSGRGLGRYRMMRAARRLAEHRLEKGLVDVLGHKMFVDAIDTLHLRANRLWEPVETAVVEALVGRGDVAVDIGAHIGYYTLLMARAVGPGGKVIAFEPDPDNCSILKRNVRINGYRNVVIEQQAVGDVSGKVTLYRSLTNLGDHRIYASEEQRPEINVDCVRLEDYFRLTAKRISFIKMDIQGAEYAAVEGGGSLWKANPDLLMIVEFWPFGLERIGVKPDELLNLLEGHGFVLYQVDEQNRLVEPVDHSRLLERYNPPVEPNFTNILCVKEDSRRWAEKQILGSVEVVTADGGT